MNTQLRRAIETLYSYIDPMAGQTTSQIGTTPEKERLTKEFIDFASYLSASDGIIATFEAGFLRDYFDVVFTVDELRKHIEANNTYSTQFEKTIPETLKQLLDRDNSAYREYGELPHSCSLAYCKVFEAVGLEFLVCDGEATENEVNDMSTYIAMLNDYRKENYRGPADSGCGIDIEAIHAGENIPVIDENGELVKSLNDYLQELDGLVGLKEVKETVNSLIHLQEVTKIRKARGMKSIPMSNHLVFSGNPGTGKTTVARLLAKIYKTMGILSEGQLIEVDRSGLVAGYVGQTALKVKDVVKTALGGILFIDEAYALSYSKHGNDYGQEAIDTLLKAMEDNRDNLIVIVAGYTELMADFVDSNPGLRSRFNRYIFFNDYNADELTQIFESMCKNAGYKPTKDAVAHVHEVLAAKCALKEENFANAREVRNYFEKAVVRQADRIFSIQNPSDELLTILELSDVQVA